MRRAAGVVLALLVLLVGACSRADAARRTADEAAGPPRIVTAGSAITEIVYALGAGDQVVGADTSSLFPEEARKVPRVGYQRTLSAEGILSLRPTLLLASAEAGPPAVVEQLRSAGLRLEIIGAEPTLAGARGRIARVAAVLGRDPAPLLARLDEDLARAKAQVARTRGRPAVVALYARGGNDTYVFGESTTADLMIALAGGVNAMRGFSGSRPVTAEAIVAAAPDVLLLPSRGLESLGGIDGVLRVPGVRDTLAGKNRRVVAVDDLLLLGFGPRTGAAVSELCTELHPEGAP
ncbi:MAG: Heme transporter, cell surface heme and hemoprotein receptor HmuT [Labilithrix sp.]|nr:Heme transporter, cell surface heme and hemoprotein receptor HmuT [Labilithrix sp.]